MSDKAVLQQRKPSPRIGGKAYYHRRTRRWAVSIDLGHDESGRRVRRTLYGRTPEDLDLKLRKERLPYNRIETILRICELFRCGHDPRASPELQKELAYQRFHEQLARNAYVPATLRHIRRRRAQIKPQDAP